VTVGPERNKIFEKQLTLRRFSRYLGIRNSKRILEKYHVEQLTSSVRIELPFLPSLAWFAAIQPFDTIWLEAAEHYQKQSYRNRCYVLTANKVDRLTVPVLEGTHKQPYVSVRIDNQQAWRDRQWRCLTAAYRKAPFFEEYAPDLEATLRQPWTHLFDLNRQMLTFCLQALQWSKSIRLTESFDTEEEVFFDDRRSLLDKQGNDQSGRLYRPVSYPQNFGSDFVPNLSILDLLFCQGPLSAAVIKRSVAE